MKGSVEAWGRRLSDELRAALAAGDLPRALRLVAEGDGQARSLATEYSLMVRGLGITVRVLLQLLAETVERGAPETRQAASANLAALLRDFRCGLHGQGHEMAPAESGTVAEECDRVASALRSREAAFEAEHESRADEIARAIEKGDAVRARVLIDAKERDGYLPLHDRLIRFMAESFGWVLRRYGSEELLRFHFATAEGQRAGFEKWERMPAAEFARTSAFLLKQHMGNVTVREDDERFTIEQTPCGSGGRLQLAGGYAGPEALPFVEAPGPLTFGEPRIPVYCSHCAIWNGVATLQWFGRAHWVFEKPARADGGCTLHIYKRCEDAPAAYADRLRPR